MCCGITNVSHEARRLKTHYTTSVSLTAHKEMKRISNEYSDPHRAYKTMKDGLRSSMNTRITFHQTQGGNIRGGEVG